MRKANTVNNASETGWVRVPQALDHDRIRTL